MVLFDTTNHKNSQHFTYLTDNRRFNSADILLMNRGIERNNLIPSSSKSEHFELFLYDPLYNRPCVLLFITGFTPRLKLL